MPLKYHQIQANIDILNCKNCGKRPVIEQRGNTWAVLCPNNDCHNETERKYVDYNAWNEQNKK